MHLSKSLIFAAALGATNVAGLVAHKHRHAEFHEKRAVGDVVTATIDGKVVTWTNEYDGSNEGSSSEAETELRSAPPGVYKSTPPKASVVSVAAAKATTTAAAASTSAASSSGSSSSKSLKVYTAFCAASKKRATEAEIAYKGNTGSTWGCNMQLIDASIAASYKYTIKFTGQNTVPWTVICWNKIGPTGLIDGWFNGNKAVEFSLSPGGVQWVAFDKNSQISCSAGPGGEVPKDTWGGWTGTWYEADFENASNGGWTGGDVSSIQAEAAGQKVYGMSAKWNGVSSSIGENLSVVNNAFTNAMKYEDGHGFNIAPGPASMEVIIDWKG